MHSFKGFKRLLACVLCVSTLCMGVSFPTAVSADEYTFNTGDARTVLSALLDGTEPNTPLGDLADRNGDGKKNTTDVRMMLAEILAGNNTVTLTSNAIRLSSISDVTDSTASRSYNVYAPYTDTYTLTCSSASSIKLYSRGVLVASGTTTVNASLQAKAGYTLTITTRYANASFELSVVANNHQVTLPNEVATPADVSNISLNNNAGYIIAASDLEYKPRENGTYIYCNNPEMLDNSSVGDALLRNTGLKNDVFVTFEHSNISSYSVYLGYQLKNEGTEDVYVTVTNVGYQTSGSWYGQKAWCDFYNTSFAPQGTYDNANYVFENYTPRVFQPITYRLPAGKAFYVVGGTSSDAYRNINVGSTANKTIARNACANAAVKFTVTGGEVTGTLYCYSRTSQVAANPAETGYRVDTNSKTGESFGVQYKGIADHAGVIDSYFQWVFNDQIGSGMLPVTYQNSYPTSSNISAVKGTPYAAYTTNSYTNSRKTEWITNINPCEVNRAVGTDLVKFRCVDTNGVTRVIDNDHNDGTGNPANTANWMIEYQEHFSLINQGSKERKVTLHYMDNGALLTMVRDSKTGEVLHTAMPVGGDWSGYNYTYEVTVPAHTAKQITFSYVLMPMSAGTVGHMATIAAP